MFHSENVKKRALPKTRNLGFENHKIATEDSLAFTKKLKLGHCKLEGTI